MFSLAKLGNDLYTERRRYDFVGQWKRWFAIGFAMMAVSAALIGVKGFNPGIEFRGGTQIQVPAGPNPEQSIALGAVAGVVGEGVAPRVSIVGKSTVQVQTIKLTDEQAGELVKALATGYDVEAASITSSFVGASWGRDVTRQALTGLAIFLVLVTALISVYFRAWQMAVAALVALVHDLFITAGVYAAVGFEVTPAAVIGFLTILGYSLYDTVVVFDKVRENTRAAMAGNTVTYSDAANGAVNQTLVRSINTSVVALLPVASILFIGAFLLGAGTLKDISLALLVGMFVGTFSSIFIATPLLVVLRGRDADVQAQGSRVAKAQGSREQVTVGVRGDEGTIEPDRGIKAGTAPDDGPQPAAGSS